MSQADSKIAGLVGWLLMSFTAAAIGAMASVNARGFYVQLTRPGWAPPGWLFGPVWTVLFAMMGVAAWLAWRSGERSQGRTAALVLFIVQLAVNALWSWLFFVWHLGALAFSEILVLWCLIFATATLFRRINGWAAALMLPYLAWVTFAAALACSTWQLNPDRL